MYIKNTELGNLCLKLDVIVSKQVYEAIDVHVTDDCQLYTVTTCRR